MSKNEMLDRIAWIDYIKLDSSEPVGAIDKMIVTKDKIFILDSHVAQQIFVFDKTGKLSFRIKNKGRGPQEYLSVWDMQIDTIRNEVLVNDPLSLSYIYYSALDGRFLRKEKGVANCYLARIDSLYINLTCVNQDFNDQENWAILVTNKDSVLFKGFKPTPLQNDNYVANNFTYNCEGALLYTPVYSDTVYQFTLASVATPKYVICQGKSIWKRYNEKIAPSEVTKLIKENNYTRYSGKFYDTENHAYFEIGQKLGDHIGPKACFWDKQTDLVYAWNTTGWDENSEIRELFREPRAVYNNTFFGTLSPQIPPEHRKNLTPKIKSLLDISEDSDNPIIVMYKLK